MSTIGPGGRIAFYRRDDGWPAPAFVIDPDGSHEAAIEERGSLPGIWSPDGRSLAVNAWVEDSAQADAAEWIRPALIRPGDATAKVLAGADERQMHLVPLGWSADGSRLLVYSGFDAVDDTDIGVFMVNAFDGGDLSPILPASRQSLDRFDFVEVSPDGESLLVSRQLKGEGGNVFVTNVSDAVLRQVNPVGTVAIDLEFWDFLERGRISEAWSPDGSRIAFGAFVLDADSPGLYVGHADGSGVKQIVSTDIGAVSAQWSPDAEWIAFTTRLRSQPQVWIVRPDGSDLTQLTTGSDGSTSVAPVWSPDGKKILFQRMLAGEVTLWTMNAEGADQKQLSSVPLGNEYVGPYSWWPATAER
ncbi:MAG: hypothetical protein ABIP53_00115 [Candidatus Limnocylindrales bacterium]